MFVATSFHLLFHGAQKLAWYLIQEFTAWFYAIIQRPALEFNVNIGQFWFFSPMKWRGKNGVVKGWWFHVFIRRFAGLIPIFFYQMQWKERCSYIFMMNGTKQKECMYRKLIHTSLAGQSTGRYARRWSTDEW